ncbi:kinase-like domain-containing protein [Lipomyces tetrasporus]|uniref:Kinase-like domain-containing protein n=1 Tax=Lipomyces tetrasporus TaxID=54092 RepID=A0AAD7QV91_9ASCO|nr:kinase-like domain-containing protein [Lipomyces tetrasporus]KAJ8102134.1 kinase-like domain-containing protein [Lipomyces tetrasporus]
MLTNYIDDSMMKSSQQSTQALMQVDELPLNASIAANSEREGRVATLLLRTNNQEKILPIYRGTQFTVGRKITCNEVVTHSAVSNEHFTIYIVVFDETSVPLVYCWDRSRNGTFLNGKTIGKGQRVLLSDGDLIEIRHACAFTFHQSNEKVFYDSVLETDRLVMTDYEISQRVIGKGTFGRVFLATNKKTSRQLACKVIETGGSVSRMAKARTEVAILERLCHPNVVSVHDTFIIGNRIYIFEDLITGGDLFSYLIKGETLGPVPEAEALVIVFQILKALEYVHSKNVAHRDLKLDNILLVSQNPGSRIVLVDFGISKYVIGSRRMTTVVGTPEFSAPEVGFADSLRQKNHRSGYDFKCDLWSLGIVLHILLSGISPFYDSTENTSSIARNARECRLNLNGAAWANISRSAKDLVKRLICVNPDQRFSVQQCFTHPWIRAHMSDLLSIYETKLIKDWQSPMKHHVISNDVSNEDVDVEMQGDEHRKGTKRKEVDCDGSHVSMIR